MKDSDYHRECGRHSGIPECCINWYIGPWNEVVAQVPYLWATYWKANNTPIEVEYIRCPVCIENSKIVMIKECDCHEEAS